MALTTFEGPIRAGTVRVGSVSVANTGMVVLSQAYTAATAVIKASPTAQPMFTLPAGSQILGIRIGVKTALVTASNCGVVVGTSSTSNYFMTTLNTGTSVAQVSPATIAAALQVDKCNNVGTSDVTVYGTFTAATGDASAGAVVVYVDYVQRNSDGSTAPTAAIGPA